MHSCESQPEGISRNPDFPEKNGGERMREIKRGLGNIAGIHT